MQSIRPHVLMVGGGKMFGVVVREIGRSTLPVDVELALADAVADPVIAHVDRLGAFLLHRVVDDALGDSVVSLDGSGWLWMAKFFKRSADDGGFLGRVEEGADFGFGCRGQDIFHDVAMDLDGAIEWGRVSVLVGGIKTGVAEKEVAAAA